MKQSSSIPQQYSTAVRVLLPKPSAADREEKRSRWGSGLDSTAAQLQHAEQEQSVSMSGFGGDQEGKAQQYVADGEKVLKKWTLFSSTTKNEDAAECFDKAARCYKVR